MAARASDIVDTIAPMMSAGLPLADSLDICCAALPSSSSQLARRAKVAVSAGRSFSDVLEGHGMRDSHIAIVRAGERSGRLVDALQNAASAHQVSERHRSDIQQAMAYPALVCTIALCIAIAVSAHIVPQFDVLSQGTIEPPVAARWLAAIPDVLARPVAMVIVGALLCLWLVRPWRLWVGRHVRRLFQGIRQPWMTGSGRSLGEFVAALGSLIEAGMTLPNALAELARTWDHPELRAAANAVRQALAHGCNVVDACNAAPLLVKIWRPIATRAVNEVALGMMLKRAGLELAALNGRRQTSRIKLIEPVLVAIAGILIGSLLLSLYIPLFELRGT